MTIFVALACIGAMLMLPTTAGAQSTKDRVAAARKEVDAAAQRWFDAQNKSASIDAHIAQLEHDIASAEQRVAAARLVASARALHMYEGASMQFAGIMGDNALDLARRAQLIDRANATNVDAINELTASIDDLRAQRKEVDSERASQAKAVKAVAAERESLDANLTALEVKASKENQAAASARAVTAARNRRALSHAAATAAPTGPVAHTVSVDAAPAPASNPAPPSGGSSSHHNDPFLVCTRARESGGNYGIASADGLYYGAYQFLPSTWDVTANHAGRGDLVGVLPNHASVFDQDEIAWALYQWQGKGPWGGRC